MDPSWIPAIIGLAGMAAVGKWQHSVKPKPIVKSKKPGELVKVPHSQEVEEHENKIKEYGDDLSNGNWDDFIPS